MADVRSAGDRRSNELARAVLAALERVRASVTEAAVQKVIVTVGFSALDSLPEWSEFWTLTKAAPRDAETIIFEAIIAGAKAEGRFAGSLGLVNQAAVDL